MNALLWTLGWTVLALLVLVPPWRRVVITGPLAALMRRNLPPLSRTEQEALEAGSVWWERDLFSGRPDWKKLLALPPPAISREGRHFLDGPVERLCHLLDDWTITRKGEGLPAHVWNFLKINRFFGLIIPREYGGLGFTAEEHSAVVQKLASRSVTAAVVVMVPNSLGPAELILHYGTEAQKAFYLPRLARGEEIPCFALTGPHAGSDAASIPDLGVVGWGEFEGRMTLGIRLDFDKRYITLAPVATLIGLAFQLRDPDDLLGGGVERGITVALVPARTQGVEVGARHDPMGIPFPNGPVRGRGVFIPVEWIVGGPERAGQGWGMLMECLAEGRAISLPALSVGAMKLAARVAGGYARVRRQFGLPIGRFEGVREPLGRIAGNLYLMEAARALTLIGVDQGERPSVVSALVKYQLTERMRRGIGDAMDVLGGAAICQGPGNLLSRLYQSVPIGITVEGANILTRTLIAFGQGVLRGHPFLLEETRALLDQDRSRGLVAFDRLFVRHVGHVLGLFLAMPWLAMGGHRFLVRGVRGRTGRAAREMSRLSARFALLAEMALALLGGSLKRREMLSGRLADALSHLYLASAVIRDFHARGEPAGEAPLFDWAMAHTASQTEAALLGVLDNFPVRWAAVAMRLALFPLGASHAPPADRLTDAVAQTILEPSSLRDHLTRGIFLPDRAEEPLSCLEEALLLSVATEGAEKRLAAAIREKRIAPTATGLAVDADLLERAVRAGVLSETEARELGRAFEARLAVVRVDEFHAAPARTPSAALVSEESPGCFALILEDAA